MGFRINPSMMDYGLIKVRKEGRVVSGPPCLVALLWIFTRVLCMASLVVPRDTGPARWRARDEFSCLGYVHGPPGHRKDRNVGSSFLIRHLPPLTVLILTSSSYIFIIFPWSYPIILSLKDTSMSIAYLSISSMIHLQPVLHERSQPARH